MPAAPANPASDIVVPTAKLMVLKSSLTERPDPDDDLHHALHLRPESYSRSAGSQKLDTLTLAYNLGYNQLRAHEVLKLPQFNVQAEVRVLDDEEEPKSLLGWGVLAMQKASMGETDESVSFTYRIDEHLFGRPLTSYPTFDEATFKRREIERPLIWNPQREVNGTPRIMGNRSHYQDWQVDPAPEKSRYWHFVTDPESTRTLQALEQHGSEVRRWTLMEAVHALCWWCNPDETWITNPDQQNHLKGVFDAFDPDGLVLKNQEQSYGKYLPSALDELLTPHGFGWYLESSLEDGDPMVRKARLMFFRRGYGMRINLLRQASGVKTVKKTNVNKMTHEVSLVDMANVIVVRGDLERREATFYLSRCWAEADDALNIEDLDREQPIAIEKPYVGRKWVCDTAGDYTGLRPEYVGPYDLAPLFDPPEWSETIAYVVGDTVCISGVPNEYYVCVVANTNSEPTRDGDPAVSTNVKWRVIDDPSDSLAIRRRKFLPCISEHTSGDDATSNRFVLEYWDPYAGIDPVAWSAGVTYTTGQTVTRFGSVWRALHDNLDSGPEILVGGENWEYVGSASAGAWSSGTTYIVNVEPKEVIDEGVQYRFQPENILITTSLNQKPKNHPEVWRTIDSTGGTWVRFKHQFSVLEHECGILFESPQIPGELWYLLQDGKQDRLRMTCSIEGDRLVQARAIRRDSSPNEQNVELVLDLPDKFQDARIVRGSKFSQSATTVTTVTHARNDTAAMQDYAARVQTVEDCAQVSCTVDLEGLFHPELEIGMLVDKIDGLDLQLDANNPLDPAGPDRTRRKLQIVGFEGDYQRQMCTVTVETFKQERPEVTW
jgi:hypothetical protein